jgi:CRISPR-associated endonuclease/helicase Cas3
VGINTEVVRGSYRHGLRESNTHRRILHEFQLELVANQQNLGGIEAWVKENLQRIGAFFTCYPEFDWRSILCGR